MNDDAFSLWIQAYREENPASRLDSRAVRRRVVSALGRRQLRRSQRLRYLLPLAATFVGTAALAASDHGRSRLEQIREWLGARSVEESRSPAMSQKSAERLSVKRVALGSAMAEAVQAPAEAVRGVSFEELPREQAPPRVGAPALAPPLELASDEALRADLSLYQVAHRLHFHLGDRARAVVAWEAYLARFPAGTFAPEARLNRAVCLGWLGRRADAHQALRPIADGRFGPHGRAQARALLETLELERQRPE